LSNLANHPSSRLSPAGRAATERKPWPPLGGARGRWGDRHCVGTHPSPAVWRAPGAGQTAGDGSSPAGTRGYGG
jgi:hypothetical protein